MEPRVVDNPAARRFELWLGDQLAGRIDYALRDNTFLMLHAEVDLPLRGNGIGERLVHDALEDVRARNGKVRPHCSFVAAYVRRHPEYTDLVNS